MSFSLVSLHLCTQLLYTHLYTHLLFSSYGLDVLGMVDRSQQRPNNADWMPPVVWDNLTEMDKIPGFQGIVSSFEQMQREWKVWYMSGKPEIEPMPADWSIKTR